MFLFTFLTYELCFFFFFCVFCSSFKYLGVVSTLLDLLTCFRISKTLSESQSVVLTFAIFGHQAVSAYAYSTHKALVYVGKRKLGNIKYTVCSKYLHVARLHGPVCMYVSVSELKSIYTFTRALYIKVQMSVSQQWQLKCHMVGNNKILKIFQLQKQHRNFRWQIANVCELK